MPKGALYCNRQLAFITQTDVGDAWDGGGRSFTGTSFAHLGFMTKLPGNLRRGGTTFIMTRWRAADALELLEREQMTPVAGVPTQLALMLRQPDFDRLRPVARCSFIVAGGGPVTPGLAEEARRRFGAVLATRYSCTEAGIGLGTAFDDPEEDAVVSVGRPHPSVDLALLDDDDRPVAAGEVGQVCLRSPAVMVGLLARPRSNRAPRSPQTVRAHGRPRLARRARPPPARRPHQGDVRPRRLQRVPGRGRSGALDNIPIVAAIAIVPRSDLVMGEIGVAVVVRATRTRRCRRSPTSATFAGAARSPPTSSRRRVHVVDELPLTAMEKVDRRALAEIVADAGRPQ